MNLLEELIKNINESSGVFLIGYIESNYNLALTLSEYLLKHTKKNVSIDVPYLKALKLKKSAFMLESYYIFEHTNNWKSNHNDEIMRALSYNVMENKSSVILLAPMYYDISNQPNYRFSSKSLVYSSNFVGHFKDSRFHVTKCRWNDPKDYDDKNLLQFFRDLKIDNLLN